MRATRPLAPAWRRVDPWPALSLPVAAAAAWLFSTEPRLVEFLAVLVLAAPLLLSPRARILFLMVGTLTVFGPEELTPAKLVFLFGVAVAVVGAVAQSRQLRRTEAYADLRPLLRASFVLLLMVALSWPVAHFNGVPDLDWLRDAAPYVLAALAPLFAFDAQVAFGAAGLRRLIVLVGLAGAAAFTFRWLVQRDIATNISATFGLGTFLVGGALFAFAMALALEGSKARIGWLAVGSLVFAMQAATGTRTTLVFLVAPVAIVFATRRHLARRSVRFFAAIPLAAVIVGVGAYSLYRVVDADPRPITGRYQLLFRTGTESDQSYIERSAQFEAAWAVFSERPLFGAGPGHPISWSTESGHVARGPNVDSPAGFLADYGLVGALAVAVVIGAFISVVKRLHRRARQLLPSHLALIGFGALLGAYWTLGSPFEDKGLAVALVLLIAAAARDTRERTEELRIHSAGG